MRPAKFAFRSIASSLTSLLLTVVLLVACQSPLATPVPIGAEIDPPRSINDVILTNQDGMPWGLKNLRDRVVLMAFAYTHCPDICPLTMADFMRVKKALGKDADQVAFLFVSVDGSRDTPPVVKQYLAAFDNSFVGLTGPTNLVQQLTNQFGAQFQAAKPKAGESAYSVAHTSFTYALDRQGRWRLTFAYQSDPEKIAARLRPLIDEPITAPTVSSAETFSNIYAGIPAKAIYMDSPVTLPDVALVNQNNTPTKPSAWLGKYVLLFFGATKCIGDCRNLWPQYDLIKKALGDKANKVQFTMISVDGTRDTPDTLRQFMQPYDASFIALTGAQEVVAPFAIQHGVHVSIYPAADGQPSYAEAHPVYSILLNPEGRWIIAFPYSMGPEAIADELGKLIGTK